MIDLLIGGKIVTVQKVFHRGELLHFAALEIFLALA